MKKSAEYGSPKTKRLLTHVKELYPYLSRKNIFELIENGSVLVDGMKKRPNYKLKSRDIVDFISFPSREEINIKPNPKIAFKILYEDDHIVAVEKPRGIPTHPIRFDEEGTLANALASSFPKLTGIGGRFDCGLLNRLDNDTSGILLAAKTKEAYETFKALFGQKRIYKEYIALVQGHPPMQGRIEKPLKHDPKNKKKMKTASVNARGKGIYLAVTDYRVIKKLKDHSLVLVKLASAVTHQIRVHFASIGHSLAGDALYKARKGRPVESTGLKGHFLHASLVRFRHPFLKKEIIVGRSFPKNWRE